MIPYTTFIHVKRTSHAVVEKNTVCNTGRNAISDCEEFSALVYVSGTFGAFA